MRYISTILIVVAIAGSALSLPIYDNFNGRVIDSNLGWSGDINVKSGWHADGAVWGSEIGSAASNSAGATMNLNFGETVSYAEVSFSIQQANETEASHLMKMGFVDNTGKWWKMESAPATWRYGGGEKATSIASYHGSHDIEWPSADSNVLPQQKLPTSGWQRFKFVFDVDEYFTVKVYTEDYAGSGELVYAAYMNNWHPNSGNAPATGVQGFTWKNKDGEITWNIDNVSVIPEPAILALLTAGVASLLVHKKD